MRLDAALSEPRPLSAADVLERAEYLRVRSSWMQRMLAAHMLKQARCREREPVVHRRLAVKLLRRVSSRGLTWVAGGAS